MEIMLLTTADTDSILLYKFYIALYYNIFCTYAMQPHLSVKLTLLHPL